MQSVIQQTQKDFRLSWWSMVFYSKFDSYTNYESNTFHHTTQILWHIKHYSCTNRTFSM